MAIMDICGHAIVLIFLSRHVNKNSSRQLTLYSQLALVDIQFIG